MAYPSGDGGVPNRILTIPQPLRYRRDAPTATHLWVQTQLRHVSNNIFRIQTSSVTHSETCPRRFDVSDHSKRAELRQDALRPLTS
jgi:hypothetical protein